MRDIRITFCRRITATILALMLCCAACTDDNPAGDTATVTDVPIGFASAATIDQPTSRVAGMDRDGLHASGFRVLAYYTLVTPWALAPGDNGDTQKFMDNQLVAWNLTTEEWEYTPHKYWPGKVDGTNYGKITFFGYAPAKWPLGTATDNPQVILTAGDKASVPTLAFTVPDASASQQDLSADVLVDKTVADGDVLFRFRHLLSRIAFTGKLDAEYPGAIVQVTSLKVKYVPNKISNHGTYTFGSTTHADGSWALTPAATSAMAAPGAGDELAPATGQPLLGNDEAIQLNATESFLMLLPQSATAGDLTLDIVWTVTTGEDGNRNTVTNRKTLSLPAATWQQGMSHTYQLNFSLTDVSFSATVTVSLWDATPVVHNQYAVTYHSNDASDRKAVRTDFSAPIASDVFPLRSDGQYFTTWNNAPNGSGTAYQPLQMLDLSADLDLYAQYVSLPTSVTPDNQWDYAFNGVDSDTDGTWEMPPAVQTFTAPADGYYLLEAWGAAGATLDSNRKGGNGGYCAGAIYLKKDQNLYVYVGDQGKKRNQGGVKGEYVPGGWNGGGTGAWDIITSEENGGGGGGATDIRLVNGSWDESTSLNSRIIVAAGGGGHGCSYFSSRNPGGAGGGLTGGNVTGYPGKAGTQTTGFSFGKGVSYVALGNACAGGGGSGYYGGNGSGAMSEQASAGGSSFISGMAGCVAIDPADETNDPRTPDTVTLLKTALNYSETQFSTSKTWANGQEIVFTSCSMIDGAGYQWNTGHKAAIPTGMPDWSKTDGSTLTGNAGEGHARITKLE